MFNCDNSKAIRGLFLLYIYSKRKQCDKMVDYVLYLRILALATMVQEQKRAAELEIFLPPLKGES